MMDSYKILEGKNEQKLPSDCQPYGSNRLYQTAASCAAGFACFN